VKLTRSQKKAESYNKIFNAARELFELHGYEQTTFRLIAKTIGMSTGVIFTFFPDKAAIFETIYGAKPLDAVAAHKLLAAR
jgi:AcrR family transcriptional regulator